MKVVETKKFKKFLTSIGLEYKSTHSSHEKWDKKIPPLLDRPIIFWGNKKEIPIFHIGTNLKTLGISMKDFEKAIKKI